jgi:hypothetical protein
VYVYSLRFGDAGESRFLASLGMTKLNVRDEKKLTVQYDKISVRNNKSSFVVSFPAWIFS